jgi:hypothetical protein
MGIDVSGLCALHVAARLYKVDFSKTVMLGRQVNYFTPRELAAILLQPLALAAHGDLGFYAEGLFKMLGAADVQSIDASNYEHASIVADFNQPLPMAEHGKYTFYCDFGSMEHIFNVPQVLRNAGDLVADGGHLLIVAPCRGFETHGFYQFSPEFFYSAFSKRNGFSRTSVFLVDTDRGGKWMHVRHPAITGKRTDCHGLGTAYVVCVTQKKFRAEDLRVQQSDYEGVTWQTQRAAERPYARRNKPPFDTYVRPIREGMRRLRRALRGETGDLRTVKVLDIPPETFWALVSGRMPAAEEAVAATRPA